MVWRCPECGKLHETEDPPCRNCGHDSLVPVNESTPVETEPRREFVWVCPECDRTHQRNSPPCKRCGHGTLEKRNPDYETIGPSGGTGYLDVLDAKYALGYLAVLGFGVLVVLSLTGVISVPWLGGPSPPGAPGDVDTYANVSLEAVEGAFVDAVDSRRSAVGAGPLTVGGRLDAAATEINQRRVRAAVDGDAPPDPGEILRRYEPDCDGDAFLDTGRTPATDVFTTAGGASSAARAAGSLGIAPGDGGSDLFEDRYDLIGVDVHVGPDGTVYSTVLAC